MGTTRMLILAVAAVAAMGLAFIVKGMATGPAPAVAQAAPAAPAKPMTKVLVAARDLPIGTRLVPEDLTWMEWPVDALNVSFITDGAAAKAAAPVNGPDGKPLDPEMAQKVAAAGEAMEAARKAIMDDPGGPIVALSGAVVKEPIFASEPITDRKLVRAGQSGYLAVVIQPGMRAMAIPVSVETAAGGFILPGDRVDVLLSRQLGQQNGGSGTAQFMSETVMRNVRVLAVDQTAAPAPGTNAVVGAVATIEVSPADAEALNLAQAQGDLSLTLRSYADITDPSGRVARAAAIASRPTAATVPQPVRVWRGGHATEMTLGQAAAAPAPLASGDPMASAASTAAAAAPSAAAE